MTVLLMPVFAWMGYSISAPASMQSVYPQVVVAVTMEMPAMWTLIAQLLDLFVLILVSVALMGTQVLLALLLMTALSMLGFA
jgi:hypothetical protein